MQVDIHKLPKVPKVPEGLLALLPGARGLILGNAAPLTDRLGGIASDHARPDPLHGLA